MKHFGAALLATTSLFAGSFAASIDPIIIKGSKFFYKNSGAQFFLKGIAYQQTYTGVGSVKGTNAKGGFSDPLADPSGCKRDIPYLKELKTNVIRVYSIDSSKSHDECMSMMADAGIYVIADLSSPTTSINSNDPSWNDDLYAHYAKVVDVMAKYDNTLGFFAGNEVATQPNNTGSAPYVKAAVRDMKAYIKQQNYRTIGVGYATNDNPDIREPLANFFNCGDQTDAIDFWGYNIYSWCGDSSYQQSGYKARTQEFSTYNIPVFFAEYGCNTANTRPFTEIPVLFGPQMDPVFSGGIVYEFFNNEANNYGVVTIGSNSKLTTLAEFKTLSSQINRSANPTSTSINAYNPSNAPQACPISESDFRAIATPLPPTPNEELCSCMYDALQCVVDPSTSTSDYSDLFGYVCGKDTHACYGIDSSSKQANYGAYSMCSASQQVSWVLNSYYLSQNKDSSACDFKGDAKTKSASVNSKCKKLLVEAGAQGTGSVTSKPTVTGAGAASAGSGSASSSSSAGGGSAGNLSTQPAKGLLPAAFVVAVGLVSGAAALLL